MKRILALILALTLMLCGCVGSKNLGGVQGNFTSYRAMEYIHPNMDAFAQLLARCETIATESEDIDEVIDMVYEFYDAYDRFQTDYNLAYIEYARDMTDSKWQAEYEYCDLNAATVDAGLEALFMALAKSPIRAQLEGEEYFGEGFFLSYEGEATWDSGFVELMTRESELINQYYDLSTRADELGYYTEDYFNVYADDMCQVLVDLVTVRREIADYTGYDSYVSFAYDFYYYRDYTPEDAMAYLEEIGQEMSELYRKTSLSSIQDAGYDLCLEHEVLAYGETVAKNMGGVVQEAFDLMRMAELYDISYSPDKASTSFELYLTSYGQPYLFLSPGRYRMDKLSFAHEFGHFVTDYAVPGGSYAGIDILEIFSQGMEYLALCYDGDEDPVLEKYKLADCLNTYVEQSGYACFEQKLYALPEEELTVENVYRLYRETMEQFGVDFEAQGWDPRDFVTIPHFYSDPMYIISYVVSNDAAFQLFQLELEERGAGLARFRESLDTECYYFLEFLEEAELESPFAPGRVKEVQETLKKLLR